MFPSLSKQPIGTSLVPSVRIPVPHVTMRGPLCRLAVSVSELGCEARVPGEPTSWGLSCGRTRTRVGRPGWPAALPAHRSSWHEPPPVPESSSPTATRSGASCEGAGPWAARLPGPRLCPECGAQQRQQEEFDRFCEAVC